jgi:hypothetical protein
VTTDIDNTKSAAWDLIGGSFWESGRTNAKPSTEEIELFVSAVPAGATVTVVGASTKDLVATLIDLGAQVTVLDFSARMCADLADTLPEGSCEILRHDITLPSPAHLRGTQQFVLNDRLVNRFGDVEAQRGAEGMRDLLTAGGVLRTSVKLGMYPMDERMIALGRERGCLERFYDAERRVIDFAEAGDVLPAALLPHGEIDPDLLLKWYRGRGQEKRFEHEDVVAILDNVDLGGRRLRLLSATPFGHAPSTRLYEAEAVDTPPGV